MEYRIQRFQELHANKWFLVMNWVLDSIKLRRYPAAYWSHLRDGRCFYFDRDDLKKRIE